LVSEEQTNEKCAKFTGLINSERNENNSEGVSTIHGRLPEGERLQSGTIGSNEVLSGQGNNKERVVSESNGNRKNGTNKTNENSDDDVHGLSVSAEAVKAAKKNGTYMKAPNGKNSNLNEKQWAQVRTKAFKDWFGDWEANAEVKIIQQRLIDWLSEENIQWATGKTRDEIQEKFGNNAMPIAYIPVKYLKLLGDDVIDNRVYSGMSYFIDHAVNHHPNISKEKYQYIQKVLSEPDEVKGIKDNGNNSVVFIKKIDRFNAVIIEVEKDKYGKIIWHKTFLDQNKKPYSNKGIQLYNVSEVGSSSIIHTDDSMHDSSLPVLDGSNINNYLITSKYSSKILDENGEPIIVLTQILLTQVFLEYI
jgi:hypothetical protein